MNTSRYIFHVSTMLYTHALTCPFGLTSVGLLDGRLLYMGGTLDFHWVPT